jgi:hypothetical protein
VTDYSNKNADEFIAKLTISNISCFDLRLPLRGGGMSQNQLFFNTDHHWTIDAAFLSAGLVAGELNENHGFGIDMRYFDKDSFNFEKYENYYIGSMGRRVGRISGGVDDFTLITPKFDTDLTFTEDGTMPQRGSFDDVVLMKEFIEKKMPLDTNRYAVYRRDEAEVIFKNHLVDEGRVLVIKDSFGMPVYSFLALGVHELRALDVRLFEGDVAEYAIEYGPDIVIMLYNAYCFNEQMFVFNS